MEGAARTVRVAKPLTGLARRGLAGSLLPVWRGNRLLVTLAALALLASACSDSGTAALAASPSDDAHATECFLGLDLWDTDPALTWVEDGRVWVRAGDHQACLAVTEASSLWWSPDGRRLFLDDAIVEGDSVVARPDAGGARQIVWQQPDGGGLLIVDGDGSIRSHELGVSAEPASLRLETNTVLLAAHPDGEYVAMVDDSGQVALAALDSGARSELLSLASEERPIQLEFSPDGSRLWLLFDDNGTSEALFVDLRPVSNFLDVEPVDSIVPVPEPPVPPPDLYFLDVDLASAPLDLAVGVGATGKDASGFVLHPSHPDWIVLTEGTCTDATSSLFMDGVVASASLPGAAVGFFRGGGLPILATTSAGTGCGTGQLWVTSGLPITDSAELVAAEVSGADIRDEAADPWNPNTAPPFA